MVMKLYQANWSPPARSALMVIDYFNVPVELVDLDLMEKKEHREPEYLKLNPLHTIPTLEDGDFVLHDSHAIITYLAQAYGKDDTLYPKDIKQKALVDQKLYFNAAVLFTRARNISYSIFKEGAKIVTEKQAQAVEEAYGFLEAFLTKNKWLAGDNMTLADIAAIATVTSTVLLVPFDVAKYPKLSAWKTEMENQPFVKKINEPGSQKLGRVFKSMMS